jgi:hypothetical protein
MKVLVFLALGTSLALAQADAPIVQQGGDCTVNVSGSSNSASLVCNSVDPKLAEQIRAILKGTRRNEAAATEISQKLDQILKQMNKETVPPLVALRFVGQKYPALQPINESSVIARDMKYTVALWNMERPQDLSPLQIPTGTFDWLKPHTEGGPTNIFEHVTSELKDGDRLFGTMGVNCPDCSRGRTYVVYIVWGKGGWVSELKNEQSGGVFVPRNPTTDREAYFKRLEEIAPDPSRIPIADPQ